MGIVKISSVLLTLIFQVLYSIRLIHKASGKDSVELDPYVHTDPIIFQSPAFCLSYVVVLLGFAGIQNRHVIYQDN
jgi:NADH:ubiquinone oxidoreductase subunit 5 (subunit L)/multisubunit Na+/H+ antiporter MnhA subunit